MPEHMSSPWTLERQSMNYVIVRAADGSVVGERYDATGAIDGQVLATLALIAAAPDLLGACKAAFADLCGECAFKDGPCRRTDSLQCAMADTADIIRAAIKKAEG